MAAAVTETAERLGVDELTDLVPGLARHELAMTIDERLPLAVRERYGMDAH